MEPQDKMKQMLAQLWEQHRSAIEGRVDVIQSACDAIERGTLTVEQRELAHSAAHKLAGVLGTFGRSEGTDLARIFETWFADTHELASHSAELQSTLTALKAKIS